MQGSSYQVLPVNQIPQHHNQRSKQMSNIERIIKYHEKQAKLNMGKEIAARERRIEHERTIAILRGLQ